MIHLISQDRPENQKYNAYFFILDEQWLNLTVHDMRSTLVNTVLNNHRFRTTLGTPMSLVTSPSSSTPMRPPIHIELASFKKALKKQPHYIQT